VRGYVGIMRHKKVLMGDHRQPSDKKTRVDLDYVRNTQAIFPITKEDANTLCQ
jgi:hypothetical protein